MDILGAIVDFIYGIGDAIFNLLPVSPILTFNLSAYSIQIGWLNWFVPFDWLLNMLGIYVGLFGVSILIRAVLRYFGVVS